VFHKERQLRRWSPASTDLQAPVCSSSVLAVGLIWGSGSQKGPAEKRCQHQLQTVLAQSACLLWGHSLCFPWLPQWSLYI
jgi:hypothetical protein